MKTNTLKLRNVVAIAICLMAITVFSSCSKEKIETSVNSIVGKWVTSGNNSMRNDTIYFTSSMRVEDYFKFAHTTLYPASSYYFTYSLIGNDIKITSHQPENTEYSETFHYILNGNSLKIKAFSNPFSLTNETRTDVHFTRIQESIKN